MAIAAVVVGDAPIDPSWSSAEWKPGFETSRVEARIIPFLFVRDRQDVEQFAGVKAMVCEYNAEKALLVVPEMAGYRTSAYWFDMSMPMGVFAVTLSQLRDRLLATENPEKHVYIDQEILDRFYSKLAPRKRHKIEKKVGRARPFDDF